MLLLLNTYSFYLLLLVIIYKIKGRVKVEMWFLEIENVQQRSLTQFKSMITGPNFDVLFVSRARF